MLPLLQRHIAERVDSMTTYMILQHEAAIANLLEVVTGFNHPSYHTAGSRLFLLMFDIIQ